MTRALPRWLWLIVLALVTARPAAADRLRRIEMPNQMTVVVESDPTTAVVAADLMLRVSVADEPEDQRGIRALVQRLLLRGTEMDSGDGVVRRLAQVGAYMDVGVGLDYVEIYVVSPADGFEVALKALSEVVRHPAFPPQEFETQKESLVRSAQPGARDPFQEVYAAFRRELYGTHPYASPTDGDPETLDSLTREQVASFHARWYRPQNAVLAVCGGVSEARVARAVRREFGDWHPGPRTARKVEPPEPLSASQVVVRELPVGRLYLILGFPAPAAGEEAYYAVQVLDSLLSGRNTARLPSLVRDRLGIAYQVSSFYPTLAHQSHLAVYLVTDPDRLSQAKQAVLEVLRGILSRPPSAEELDLAKRYLRGSYLLGHQRVKDQAYALAWYEVLGLGADFGERYLSAVQAVTPQDVQNAARSVLRRFVLAVGLPED